MNPAKLALHNLIFTMATVAMATTVLTWNPDSWVHVLALPVSFLVAVYSAVVVISATMEVVE